MQKVTVEYLIRIGEMGAHQQFDGRPATTLSMMSKYMLRIKTGLEATSRVAVSGRAEGQARKRTNVKHCDLPMCRPAPVNVKRVHLPLRLH